MTRFSSLLFTLLAFLSIVAQSQTSFTEGSITGFIVMEDGQIGSDANACYSYASSPNSHTMVCNRNADKDGRFTISHLKPGTYSVFATNDSEGYSLQSGREAEQTVVIDADHPAVDLVITMRGRGGILVGSVVDASTGKPVRNAWLELVALDGRSFTSGAQIGDSLHTSIPPNRELLTYVNARGYKGWVYTDPANPNRPVLKMAPGERRELHIELQPEPGQQASKQQ